MTDEAKALLEAANRIQQLCKDSYDCDKCPFHTEDETGKTIFCPFSDVFGDDCSPYDWVLARR